MPTLAIPLTEILTDRTAPVDSAALPEAEAETIAHSKSNNGCRLPEPLHIHRIPLQKN